MNAERLSVVARVGPDVFAVVMATGIVAHTASQHGHGGIGAFGGGVATGLFIGLIGAAAWKISTRPHVVRAEIGDPGSVFAMFTFVAAACVLSVVWADHAWVVALLTVLAFGAWAVYVPLLARAVARSSRVTLRDNVRGGWLLVSVATSGLAIVAARAAVTHQRPGLVAVAVGLWLAAVVSYIVIVALILWRVVASRRPTVVATPDGWILMGALAIATLAMATIHRATLTLPELADRIAVARAADVAIWVIATGWIPVLIGVHLWVVTRRRRRLGFANPWWSAVFPAGMYSSASAMAGEMMPSAFIEQVSTVAMWVAFGAWVVTAVAMTSAGIAWLRLPRTAADGALAREPGCDHPREQR